MYVYICLQGRLENLKGCFLHIKNTTLIKMLDIVFKMKITNCKPLAPFFKILFADMQSTAQCIAPVLIPALYGNDSTTLGTKGQIHIQPRKIVRA